MNVLDNKYEVTAILKDGSSIPLNGALTQLSWQDPAEEIAQRAQIRLAQTRTSRGWLNSLLPLCTVLLIRANGGEVFRGVEWEWEYESGNGGRDIALTCYDHFIYAQNSKTFARFPAGKSTRDVVGAICGANGIRLDYQYGSAVHDKLLFRSRTVADQILDVLKDAEYRLGKPAVPLFEGGGLAVREEAYNRDVYVFRSGKSAVTTSERLTMDGLVTRVAIYGAEDKEDRRRLEATLDGRTEFGVLQDVVLRTGSTTMAAAKQEAQKILKDSGTPKKTITATVPDVPQIRKGWKVKLEAGSLLGYYIVKGVTHNATERSMVLELKNA